jgi:hypothetical protein
VCVCVCVCVSECVCPERVSADCMHVCNVISQSNVSVCVRACVCAYVCEGERERDRESRASACRMYVCM